MDVRGAFVAPCGIMQLTPVQVACGYKLANCGLCGSCSGITGVEAVEQPARCGYSGVTTGDLRLGIVVLWGPILYKGGFAVFATTDLRIGTTGCSRN